MHTSNVPAAVHRQSSWRAVTKVITFGGDWSSRVTERTRTCSYDRLGTGASDKATGCRQLKDLNGDLEALLRATGEDGPYVLVGVRWRFPDGWLRVRAPTQDVKGMAFVETPHAIIAEEAPPELLQELKCDSPMNERRDYVAVENEAWANGQRIGDIPLVVISNDYGDDYDNEEQRTNVEDQKDGSSSARRRVRIVVTSGHDVPENEPDLVIKEILQVLEATEAVTAAHRGAPRYVVHTARHDVPAQHPPGHRSHRRRSKCESAD